MPARPPRRTAATARGTRPGATLEHLEHLEREGGDGTLRTGGATLHLTSLDKIFFPAIRATKGELMRYYVRMARLVLPVMRDRPLSQRRFPNGTGGESFYQQKPPEHVPSGVRVAEIETEDEMAARRFVGGRLATLLYTIQLGNIAVHPWHSRIRSLAWADYCVLDLDPGPRAPFQRVVEVARWVHAELDALAMHAAVKTSGSTGIHIVVPLPPRTSYETSARLAERVARRVVAAHPRETTLERARAARPPAAVYVDHLQNAPGKTIAAAYCVRAHADAPVSTPLRWSELTDSLDRSAFTIETVPARVGDIGDPWRDAMRARNRRDTVAGAVAGVGRARRRR